VASLLEYLKDKERIIHGLAETPEPVNNSKEIIKKSFLVEGFLLFK